MFDEYYRYQLERSQNEEARAVLEQLRAIEKNDVDPLERDKHVNALAWGLERYRQQLKDYHREELQRARETFEKQRDRNATTDAVRLRRLEAKVKGMTDAEVFERVQELKESTVFPNGDEVDLLSERLRGIKDADIELEDFRRVAKEKRCYEPWTHDGPGREAYDALEELNSRKPGHVVLEAEGHPTQVPLADVADFAHEMDSTA